MKDLLKTAEKNYKEGEYFLSATKNVKAPIKVTFLKISENYPNCIVNSEGGVICEKIGEEVVWAEKVKF